MNRLQTANPSKAPTRAKGLRDFGPAILTLLWLVLLACDARIAMGSPLRLLEAAGLERADGTGSINGVRFPVSRFEMAEASPADLLRRVRAAMVGRATVTEHLSEFGVVLFAWNLASAACPTCRAPELRPADQRPAVHELLERLFDEATILTLQVLPAGGGLIMATPAGPLRRAVNATPTYKGHALPEISGNWRIEMQTSYQFADFTQHHHMATSTLDLNHADRALQEQLMNRDFKPVAPTTREGQALGLEPGRERFFERGDTVLRYALRRNADGTTQLQLDETISRPANIHAAP